MTRRPGDGQLAATIVAPDLSGGVPTVVQGRPVVIETGRLVEGQRIGRYEIVGLIGRGGMGEVYSARDLLLDRMLAVKVLLADASDTAASTRLVREAQALARLSHPNVVAVFDAGEDRGLVFLAMQYVDGENLATYLHGRSLSWRDTLALYVEAGRGLAAAHAAGMVHRDFKPGNVLVDRGGKVAVTDFGVARAAGPTVDPELSAGAVPTSAFSDRIGSGPVRDDLTRQGELIGTPAYMAWEQFTGGVATPATDQFAYCVAVWEALFGTHPYVPPDSDGTVFAIGTAVDAAILRVPQHHAVPRRVVAALTRGLARDPERRWPNMNTLLAELVRASAPRRWPWLLAGGAVLVAGIVAMVLSRARSDPPPACDLDAKQRIAAVWRPERADAIATSFAATGRAYASTTAAQIRTDLDSYAGQWTASVTDACMVARRGAGERAQASRRLACLDRAHAAFAATVGALTTDVDGVVVDNARAAVDALPRTADCAARSVGADAPPAAIAHRLAELEPRLDAAAARIRVGQYRPAGVLLAALEQDAADLAWEPFQARLAFQLAANAANLGHPSHADFVSVARRAGLIGAHRLELDAWLLAIRYPPDTEALTAAATAATAAAAALGTPRSALEVSLAQGRGLNRLRKFPQAASLCTDGLAAARADGWVDGEAAAADCLAEALLPLGRFGELEPILDRDLAIKISQVGADHPAVADLLVIRAGIMAEYGKHAEAEAALQRALEIRIRVFGPTDIRVASSKQELADLFDTSGDPARALATANEALAIAMAQRPPPDELLYKIHRDLGMYSMSKGDLAAVRHHMELALASAKRYAGDRSLDVGFVLLMYGQYQTAWKLDDGLASLRTSIAIFDEHADPRGTIVRAALANILLANDRAREARPMLEDAVGKLDLLNTEPTLVAQIYLGLAKALVATRGDRARARALADDAINYMTKAGNFQGRQDVVDWLAKSKLPPAKSRPGKPTP